MNYCRSSSWMVEGPSPLPPIGLSLICAVSSILRHLEAGAMDRPVVSGYFHPELKW